MEGGCIALIGLGAIGVPLAHKLYAKYGNDFVLLADRHHAQKLRKDNIYINGDAFSPKIVCDVSESDRRISYVFVCVKNYSIAAVCDYLKTVLVKDTVVIPLQNGVFSFEYMKETFPDNVVLEAFAQGPNTVVTGNGFVYQNSGEYHIGTSFNEFMPYVETVNRMLSDAGISCKIHSDIKHEIWKKLMLNAAGNALTAITGIDYKMMKHSPEALEICRLVMDEFSIVAAAEGIVITDTDIENVLSYFISYDKSKRTSMLEDVLNHRKTENEYIAGYIMKLAKRNNISVPYIEMLYKLVKIKEDIYMGKLE